MTPQELDALRARILEAERNGHKATFTDLDTLMKNDPILCLLVSTCMRALFNQVQMTQLRGDPLEVAAA